MKYEFSAKVISSGESYWLKQELKFSLKKFMSSF